MDTSLKFHPIHEVQGNGLYSPLAEQHIRTDGVVTGVLRRGFYLQTPSRKWDGACSDALFVYSRDWRPELGMQLEISGEVVDYLQHDHAKPVTQLHLDQVKIQNHDCDTCGIEPIVLTPEVLPLNHAALAHKLNSLEGMVLRIEAGQTFIAPSNPFGDYVVALDDGVIEDSSDTRTSLGGVLISPNDPNRWYPGFRVYNYNHAHRLNVGAKLLSAIEGPLHYRVDSWQMVVNRPFEIDPSFVERTSSTLAPKQGSLTVMTLNCFNLDPHIESEKLVMNPRQDIDDDWGDGRFHSLAQAVVLQANCPDIVALQEIQDNDGAEITTTVAADRTYEMLIKTIEQLSSVCYEWVSIDPVLGEDGGQPGGNIRNGYLYNPKRVRVAADSVQVLGQGTAAFDGSRKPLSAIFVEKASGKQLACINVHFASKRHQRSIFSPENPGYDTKLAVRVEQAELVRKEALAYLGQGVEFYVTGDFNDTEHSDTLQALCAGGLIQNLVLLLPEHERYDYNHRGKLQVLMHGLVSPTLAEDKAEYEIIHGNELIGVTPNEESDKPSDHAYVIARLHL